MLGNSILMLARDPEYEPYASSCDGAHMCLTEKRSGMHAQGEAVDLV